MKHKLSLLSALCLFIAIFAGYYKPAEAWDDYDVRLVNYENVSGYLEIHWNGSWFGVNADHFDSKAGRTACRALGFDYLCRHEPSREHFQSDVETFNQYPWCTGKEESFSACEWSMTSQSNELKQQTKRLMLKCVNAEDNVLRLHGGVIPTEGAPQIRCDSDEQWKFLCGTRDWDARDCHVVCTQMGYKMCTRWKISQSITWNASDVISARFLCGFSESHLLECDTFSRECKEFDGIAWMSCGIEADIQGTGNAILCGSDHTCTNQCGHWHRDGRCNCDAACSILNDCCFDFDQVCNREGKLALNDSSHSQFYEDSSFLDYVKCVSVGIHLRRTAYILVAECPRDYTQEGTIKQCEQDPSVEDVIARTPVNDNNGVIFRNVYCAICHERTIENISPWDVVRPYLLGSQLVKDDVFGIYLSPVKNHDPIVNFQSGQLRACHQHVNFSCAESDKVSVDEENYTDFRTRCPLYYAPITLSIEDQSFTTFQNPDCYVCTDHPLHRPPKGPGYCQEDTNYGCQALGSQPCGPVRAQRHYSELKHKSVRFNFSKLDYYAEKQNKVCRGEGVTYDPFLDICRVLECPDYYCNIGLSCVPCSVPDNVSIAARIFGDTDNEGTIQILHEGKWYTALRELFDEKASEVLCREIGLEYEPTYFVGRQNMVNSQWSMDNSWYTLEIQCDGSERTLSDCRKTFPSQPIQEINITAAAITCANKTETRIRLTGGILPSEGYVQVQFGEREPWHFISGDNQHWDLREGKAVCRQLNFTSGCASSSRLPAPSITETTFAVTRHFFCSWKDDRIYSCDSEPYWVNRVDSLAWVTCAIAKVNSLRKNIKQLLLEQYRSLCDGALGLLELRLKKTEEVIRLVFSLRHPAEGSFGKKLVLLERCKTA